MKEHKKPGKFLLPHIRRDLRNPQLALMIYPLEILEIFDTVAEILNLIWTGQVIVFILPVLTFFPKGANYVRTGCIRARLD